MNSSVRKTNWHHEIEDLKQAGTRKDMINERGKFRNKIKNMKFEVKEKKKLGALWTDQRKHEHIRMKRFWEEKKKNVKL